MKPLTPLMIAFGVLAGLVAIKQVSRTSVKSLVEEAGLVPMHAKEFTEADVAKVEVTAPGGTAPAYSLVREGTSWRVVSTFTAPANGAEVTKLVDGLAKAEGELRTDDASVLEQFDLTNARAVVVRVLDASGAALVHVGVGRSSGQRSAFVRNLAANDSKAFVVATDVRGLLGLPGTYGGSAAEPAKPDPAHFHSRDFPQFKLDKAKSVEFAAPGRRVSFEKVKKDEKDASGEWQAAPGAPEAPLKKDGIEKAISSLGGTFSATALVDPAKKKELGFDAPQYRIAVTSEDGTTRAAVGQTNADATKFYVRIDAAEPLEVLWETSEYSFHQLFPTGANLFDFAKWDLGKDTPTRVVVETTGRDTIEIARKGTKPADDWTLVAPAWPLTAKQSALRGVGSALTSLRILDYIDDPAEPPAADTTVRYGAAGAPDADLDVVLVAGKAPSGKDRLAQIGGRWFTVPENAIERLAPEPLSLVETKVMHGWDEDDVTAVRVGADQAFSLVKDGEGWAIEEGGAKKPASKDAVEKWLDRLLAVSVTGVLPGDADFKSVPLRVEREEGEPREFGASVTSDGRRVVVLGATILTVDDKEDLVPRLEDLAEKKPEPAKDEPAKDGEKKEDPPK